jgi:tryptophan synthase beta chain
MGLFHEFVKEAAVRLIGVEAAGESIASGKHAATLPKVNRGFYMGQ